MSRSVLAATRLDDQCRMALKQGRIATGPTDPGLYGRGAGRLSPGPGDNRGPPRDDNGSAISDYYNIASLIAIKVVSKCS